MQRHAKAALVLVVLGLFSITGWRILEPFLKASTQANITDASSLKSTLTIAVDGWVGYFPLCSPEMKKRLRRDGYGLQCVDDSANYRERFRKLDNNEYDFAVATVDSYVLNGEQFHYPGAIIAVIDESKGGDAIVARRSMVASLENLKSAQGLKVAYTPASPSHHLIKSVASHFDIPSFKDTSNHLLTDGSDEAFLALKDGRADVAILWEPDVSRALDDEAFVRLLGTEDTRQLIVDILLASRRVAKKQHDMVKTLLKNYFQSLKFYKDNPDALNTEMSKYARLDKAKVASLLAGVEWATLSDNAEKWYSVDASGFSQDALVNTIASAVDILTDNGDFSQNPLPNRDAYGLLKSEYIEELHRLLNAGGWRTADRNGKSDSVDFRPLNESQWDNLQEIGSLKARKITFASGASELTDDGRVKIDELVKDLQHYPTFRIEVRGHTGVRGDPEVNMALSGERAEAVLLYMLDVHDLRANRIRALGFGGNSPLPKQLNESNRAYSYRLPRVELVLVRETI